MRSIPVILILLFSMLWQSVAMARMGSTVNVLVDVQHAALHWQEEGHHHHEDGSYQLDDSTASAQHLAVEQLSASMEMTAPSSLDFPPMGPAAPDSRLKAPVSNPTLDGLLRPPRSRA